MVAVAAPAPGDMEGLEGLLDKILGAKMAKLFGGPNVSLLDRVEAKLGQVLDRHFADKVEPFYELIGMTKSPLIKGKNIEVFVKGIMPGLLDAAAKAGKEGAGAAGAKRAAAGGAGGGGKKAKTAAGGKGKKGAGAQAKASAAASLAASDDVSSLGDISSDDEDGGASSAKSTGGGAGGGGGGVKTGLALVDDPEAILAESDGKLRGELHLVERCPALIYKSWRDVDHDVYTFGLPQLAAAKRKLADDGVIALFLGFGQYKDYTAKGFRAIAMKPAESEAAGGPHVRTCDRPWGEVFAFLEKGAAMRGNKGEAARRKAYVAAVQFFQRHVYKLDDVTEEDPFPPLPRKLAPKQAKAAKKKVAAARKQARAAGTLPPATAAAAPAAVAAATGPSPVPPAAAAEAQRAPAAPAPVAAPAAAAAAAPAGEEAEDEEEPEVWATMPDANDKSIRGLFASLRWRLERLEAVCGEDDPFVWSLKSSQGNIDNLCDRLFADGGDPEAEDWKRMVGSSCDKARKKVEDKLRALGGGPESAQPAAVHGRAVLELYGELKGAVQRFEEGEEDAVEGWDSLEFIPGPQAKAAAALAAAKKAEKAQASEQHAAEEEAKPEAAAEAAAAGAEEPAPMDVDAPAAAAPDKEEEEEKEGSVAAEQPGGPASLVAPGSPAKAPGSPAKPAPAPKEEQEEEQEEKEQEEEGEQPAAPAEATTPPAAPAASNGAAPAPAAGSPVKAPGSPSRPAAGSPVKAPGSPPKPAAAPGSPAKPSQPQEDAAAALLGLVGASPVSKKPAAQGDEEDEEDAEVSAAVGGQS